MDHINQKKWILNLPVVEKTAIVGFSNFAHFMIFVYVIMSYIKPGNNSTFTPG